MKLVKLICTFIATLTLNGVFAQPSFDWGHSMGSGVEDRAFYVTSDNLGNVITTGYFKDTVDFDPGVGVFNLIANGSRDGFVQKLDPSGNFLWACSFGNVNNTTVYCATVDANNNIIISGDFHGTVDFDPGTGVSNLSSMSVSDGFILKLNASGNFVWVKQIRSSSYVIPQDIKIKNSQYYLTGGFAGTADFDPSGATYSLTSNTGGYEQFVLKLDGTGNFKWAKATSGTNGYGQRGNSITLDTSSNVYTTGVFYQTTDFDPGAGVNNLTSSGAEEVFVQKLDSNGNFLWAKAMGGTSTDIGYSIDLDENENPVISGSFKGTADFDPNPPTSSLTSNGGYDMFVVKLSSSGNHIWSKQIGGVNQDQSFSLVCDNLGNNFITGNFYGKVDVDPGTATYFIDNTSRNDAFVLILKLNSTGAFVWATTTGPHVAYSVALDNTENILVSGYFSGTVDADPSSSTTSLVSNGANDCSVVKFSQCSITTSTINPTACSSYTSPSGKYTWTASNTYTDTLKNTGGCDSVITINLTINNPVTGVDMITACDSITWIDGKTYYTNNNTATDTIAGGAANGCDSIVTLNLTINTVNATTTASNDTITASATGATYQWLDCDNNYAVISGATNQMFIATANGHYAVAVTQNGCTDTSACVTVTGVGIDENSLGADVKVYPNPTTGIIHIDPGKVTGTISVKISSIEGKTVYQGALKNGKVTNIMLDGEAGIYIVEIKSNTGASMNYRIIKK